MEKWLYSYRIKKDNTISDYTIIIIIKHVFVLYNNNNKYNNNNTNILIKQ